MSNFLLNVPCADLVPLLIFKASWCGACKRMKPIWDEAVQYLEHHSYVDSREFEETEKDQKSIFSLFHIDSYPTILIYKCHVANPHNRYIRYTGKANVESLIDFVTLHYEEPADIAIPGYVTKIHPPPN
jgi:thiol-disulfide isomerase/thioredoxin